MEVNNRVNLSGTKKIGTVIDIDARRDIRYSSQSTIVFVKVKWDDGTEMEYVVNELRKI